MKRNCLQITLALLLVSSIIKTGVSQEQAKGPFLPTEESLSQFEIPEWIKDAKLGFWAHWGPQAQPAMGDWYARGMYMPGEEGRGHHEHHVKTYGHPSEFGFKDLIMQWEASKFNEQLADSLMKIYKRAGADFFVSIAHHHDNFDMWDSKHHKWNAVKVGPKKNIMKIWEDAARGNGLRFGITSHLARSPNWWSANKNSDKEGAYAGIPYDGANSEYQDLYHPLNWDSDEYNWKYKWFQRVSDVIEKHSPDFIYVDGGVPFKETYGLKLLANYYNQNYREHNNKLEGFILSKELENIDYSVYDIEFCHITKQLPRVWFDDTFIGHWFWNKDYEDGNIRYSSSNYQIDHLIDVVSKNGVVMVVIPQRADGSVHKVILNTLEEMGDWMTVNGEGIRNSRPFYVFGEGPSVIDSAKKSSLEKGEFENWRDEIYRTPLTENMTYNSEHVRYTLGKDGKSLYAFLLGWPDDKTEIKLGALGLYQVSVDSVELLGSNEKIEWDQGNSFLTINLPDKAPFEQAVCFKMAIH